MKLDEVEKELNEMEKRSKVDEKDYIDLHIAKQQLDTYKVCCKVKTSSYCKFGE